MRANNHNSPEDNLRLREQEGHAERLHPEAVSNSVPHLVRVYHRLYLVLRDGYLSGQNPEHKSGADA